MPRESSTKRRSVPSRISAPVPFLLHILDVVDQQDVPRIFQRGQRKAGICRVQPQNGPPIQQRSGQHCLSEAAGCAEKEHPAAFPEGLKRPCGRRLDDDGTFVGHGLPSLRQRGIVPRGTPWDSEGTLAVINLCPINFFSFYYSKVLEKCKSVQSMRRDALCSCRCTMHRC